MLVGLAAPAQFGKDSVADVFVKRHGYRQIALATKMKTALYALDPWIIPRVSKSDGIHNYYAIKDALEVFPTGRWRLQEVIAKVGWDIAKQIPEVRGLLQRLGTEAGRQVLGQDVWIKAAFPQGAYSSDKIVVSDIRFNNEADFIRSRGGQIIHIDRPGWSGANGHSSEKGIIREPDDWEIVNDGALEDLVWKVEGLMTVWARIL